MTDDLVKRLDMANMTTHPMTLVIVAREAADRIEQLEAALLELIAWSNAIEVGAPEFGGLLLALDRARAALGEKKDG